MKRIISLFALSLFISTVMASSLSIEDAIVAAKGYDADFTLASQQYSNAVALTNRQSSFTPSLSLSGSISTGASFFDATGFEPMWSGLSGSVGLSTGITFSGSQLTEKKAKELSNESALLSLESTELDLESSVVTVYLSLVSSRSNIEVYKSSLESAEDNYASVSERYSIGRASELELLQAENAVSSAEYALKTLESSYSLYLDSFENLTGLDAENLALMDISEISIVEVLPFEDLYARYAYSSPQIKQMELAARTSDLEYQETKNSSLIPSMSLSANYNFSGRYNSTSTVSDGLSVSASISMPLDSLFSSSSSSVNIAKAENAKNDAKTEYANALVDFKYTLKQACQSIELAAMEISNQEKTIASLEKQQALTKEAYLQGEESFSQLKSVENELLSAKYTLVSLKCSYLQSLYSLSHTLGVPYTDILQET